MYSKDCINCGKKMFRKSRVEALRENWKYCCYACNTAHRNKIRVYVKNFVDKNCKFCNLVFKVRDTKKELQKCYCSISCSSKSRKKFRHKKETKEKTSGENHYNWLGDNVKYEGLHDWIRKIFNTEKCEHCGILGERFPHGAWSIECANKSGLYKRDVTDWIALCRKCHRKYDISQRGTEVRSCSCGVEIIAVKGFRKRYCTDCLKNNKS